MKSNSYHEYKCHANLSNNSPKLLNPSLKQIQNDNKIFKSLVEKKCAWTIHFSVACLPWRNSSSVYWSGFLCFTEIVVSSPEKLWRQQLLGTCICYNWQSRNLGSGPVCHWLAVLTWANYIHVKWDWTPSSLVFWFWESCM